MRGQLLSTERILVLQEEIAGFLLDQVIDPKGEYYYPLPPHKPLVIVLRRQQGNMYEKLYMYIHVYV